MTQAARNAFPMSRDSGVFLIGDARERSFQHTFFIPHSVDVDVVYVVDAERNVEIVEVRHTATQKQIRPTAHQRLTLEAHALDHHDAGWR